MVNRRIGATFSAGDKVRSPVFIGIGEVIGVETNERGRTVAMVKFEKGLADDLTDTGLVTMSNLRPAELPGYDLEYTAPHGDRSWITPALIRDVRTDPRISEGIQDKIDQILTETALDPDEWDSGIWEMVPGWIGAIRAAARERGLA
jgi:hypothetical protein